MIAGWCAALTIIGGALCLYVSARHQVLVIGRANARPWRLIGAASLVLGLVLLLTVQGPATAVFTWATGAMLMWSVVPVIARWWRFRGEAAK